MLRSRADTTARALSRLTVFTNFLIVPAPLHGVRQELSEDRRDISAGHHIVYSSLAKRTTNSRHLRATGMAFFPHFSFRCCFQHLRHFIDLLSGIALGRHLLACILPKSYRTVSSLLLRGPRHAPTPKSACLRLFRLRALLTLLPPFTQYPALPQSFGFCVRQISGYIYGGTK